MLYKFAAVDLQR